MTFQLRREDLDAVTFVVFDFDGVFTDNRVLVMEDGREAVFCSRADGLGLQALVRSGVGCLVLSTETNPVVSARAAKLGLECVQGLGDTKWEALQRILTERGINPGRVAACRRWDLCRRRVPRGEGGGQILNPSTRRAGRCEGSV